MTHTLTDLTDKDIQMIRAALSLASPSGGGSEPFSLLRKITAQTPEVQDDETFEMTFSANVIAEAREAGVI